MKAKNGTNSTLSRNIFGAAASTCVLSATGRFVLVSLKKTTCNKSVIKMIVIVPLNKPAYSLNSTNNATMSGPNKKPNENIERKTALGTLALSFEVEVFMDTLADAYI